ncbi:MAG TPA: hypothetical protein ENJ19_10635 [Gammaproteobacteria bacterium]|nr:hypothetical protein [Gammaproteobacteria bacterium]
MVTLSTRNQIWIGAGLALLLIATRGQHFATSLQLPGASWAVFFLAGVYLRPVWVLPALLAFVWGLDFTPHLLSGASLAEIVSGGQAFCLTPAYVFLVPAYAALWFAGRWYARRHRFEWRTLLPLVGAALAGAMACELFSSGGFYFFSGRFAEPSLAGFGARLVKYFPGSLHALAFYAGIAATAHALLGFAAAARRVRRATAA